MLEPDAVPVYLTRGMVAYVSAIDAEWVKAHKWTFNGERSPYAVRTARVDGRQRRIYLHRCILHAPEGMVVHHKSGDTMDCTRSNLEVVRLRSNVTTLRTKKGMFRFTGVSLRGGMSAPVEGRKCFIARLYINGECIRIGAYCTPEEAALAYDHEVVRRFGMHADTNYPLDNYLCPGIRAWGYPQPEEKTDHTDLPF